MINIDLENGLLKPVPSCLLLTSVTLVLTKNKQQFQTLRETLPPRLHRIPCPHRNPYRRLERETMRACLR